MNSPRLAANDNQSFGDTLQATTTTIVKLLLSSYCCYTIATGTIFCVTVPTTLNFALDITQQKVGKKNDFASKYCHDTNLERPRLPPAASEETSEVRHVQEPSCRESDLSLSCLEEGSKPGQRG